MDKITITQYKETGKYYDSCEIETSYRLDSDSFLVQIEKHRPTTLSTGYIVVSNVNDNYNNFINKVYNTTELITKVKAIKRRSKYERI